MNHDDTVSDRLSEAIGEFRAELLDWIETEMVRLQQRTVDATTEKALAELNADRQPAIALADPRERLDTLARLLDRRIKQARGAERSGSGYGTRPNAGLEGDPAEASTPECRR
jgi:hypothetical protein